MSLVDSDLPALVLGGSGYVAGELLRLIAGHPALRVAAVFSESRRGERVEAAFPHLAGSFQDLVFSAPGEIANVVSSSPRLAVFSALPHGVSAARVGAVLAAAEQSGSELRVVDLSADFRFPEAATWESVYRQSHGAPDRVGQFTCGLPEHLAQIPTRHLAHPGCFTSAVLLAAVPLLRYGLVEPELQVVAITGSTGAGRGLSASTHHPERRSNLFAYAPLGHRHQPEMEALAWAASGVEPKIHFIPHAGPFARGIHATVLARLRQPMAEREVRGVLEESYRESPFVEVLEETPRLQAVVGTNRCHLAVAVDGQTVALFSALDNLVKGAAGGAVQWMNRLLGIDQAAGLGQPGVGWL